MENKEIQHPSFGILSFSRINGGSGKLFGTDITPNNYIQLKLDNGMLIRDECGDRTYSDNKNLFTVKMSANQFAELITSMNTREIPVTIERKNGIKVEPLNDIPSRKEELKNQLKDNFKNNINEIKKLAEELNETTNTLKLSKSNRKRINDVFNKQIMLLESDMPYLLTTFAESMDKIVLDAKMEIDADIQHKIVGLGMEELLKRNKEIK